MPIAAERLDQQQLNKFAQIFNNKEFIAKKWESRHCVGGSCRALFPQEIKDLLKTADNSKATAPLNFIIASLLLSKEPKKPDQILKDIIDVGDKMAFIGSSKLWKSFFLLQCLICLATGKPFLLWTVPQARRILYIQLEIRENHFHRRFKNLCKALNISPEDLSDRLLILNGRGLGITGREGINRIIAAIQDFKPEIIVFDPLYKILQGVENAAEDVKIMLNYFDELAEQTGAAIFYVHHDPKGSPGDRDIRDRGAGSNVLGRDYDACITLTAHAQNSGAAVVDILLRNYPPQEPFTIEWSNEEDGGYCFRLADDILPEKKTSRTKQAPIALSTYLPIAESILGTNEMDITSFKAIFKEQTALSDHRIRDFFNWANAGNPRFIMRDERGKGVHKKWIRINDNE